MSENVFDERARAISSLSPSGTADGMAIAYATIYVGDQLARLADMVEGGFDMTKVVYRLERDSKTERAGYVTPRRT